MVSALHPLSFGTSCECLLGGGHTLIIVLGGVIVDEAVVTEALELSKTHVARSRMERGCISHAVYQDPDIKGKLVFVEKWQDQDSLTEHFRVPASIEFVKALGELALEPPYMSVFSAEPLTPTSAPVSV